MAGSRGRKIVESPVRFRVAVARPGGEEQVLEEREVTNPHAWEVAPVDLSAFAGESVTLALSVESETPGALGFWGAPAVRHRGAIPSHAENVDPPQGVIFILCDSLRRDHLDAYGYDRPTAPNLTRMAEGGRSFSTISRKRTGRRRRSRRTFRPGTRAPRGS